MCKCVGVACRCVDLEVCKCVGVWICRCVVVKVCGCVGVWMCRRVDVWVWMCRCVDVLVWMCRCVDVSVGRSVGADEVNFTVRLPTDPSVLLPEVPFNIRGLAVPLIHDPLFFPNIDDIFIFKAGLGVLLGIAGESTVRRSDGT